MAIIQHLIVEEYGSFIGKKSGRLLVTCQGEKRLEAPVMHLESVLVTGRGISVSSDAVESCVEQGIPIHFLDHHGHPLASLYSSALTATAQTRRAQLQARDGERGAAFARASAGGKIKNQANLLKYMSKYRKERQPEVYETVRRLADEVMTHLSELETLPNEVIDTLRGRLLSVEGRAAHYYWQAIRALLPADFAWPGRRTQGATDPLNAALNYGYGILYSQVERSLVLAGLDPYAGFLHVDRPGKASLVFDLVEEFRQTVVDRTVIAMVNRNMAISQDEEHLLDGTTRKEIAAKVLERLDAAELYEERRVPLRTIIQSQARHLATFLRGERAAYDAFVAGW